MCIFALIVAYHVYTDIVQGDTNKVLEFDTSENKRHGVKDQIILSSTCSCYGVR